MKGALRASFVRHRLSRMGAVIEEVAGCLVAVGFREDEDRRESALRMGLCDLSPLPKCGFKGSGAPEWLAKKGVELPAEPNKAVFQGGILAVSLSWQERLLLNSPGSGEDDCAKFAEAWSFDEAPGCYSLPRNDTHCWFAVTGAHASGMLAKLCGVDLRPEKFADGEVAQTSLARNACIVIRNDFGSTPGYYLLADSASAEYLWICLEDAMAEFEGAVVGLKTLRSMA